MMKFFLSAFWAEILKARRAKITLLTAAGILLLPCAAGLFMVILKDPEQARAMGLISQKARLTAGSADWPAFFNMMAQGHAGLGAVMFSLITAWVFGREFSDRTAKEVLALPAPRFVIVGSKLALIFLWALVLSLAVHGLGLAVGAVVTIPGWTQELGWQSFSVMMQISLLTILLMSPVAFASCVGKGYLFPVGWTILTLALANVAVALGWGDWFPWSVPLLLSRTIAPGADPVEHHGLWVVAATSLAGSAALFWWWYRADHTR